MRRTNSASGSISRRRFVAGVPGLWLAGSCVGLEGRGARATPAEADEQPVSLRQTLRGLPPSMRWLQSARVFLIDAYAYPFAPELEFDARELAATMVDVHANVVRMATMGKYATIQGVRFSRHPAQGDRDLLAETIAACKPRGIRVVPYISTGHKLAWSMLTRDYPQYAHISRPGGGPVRTRFGTGEDHGTVCWNTPYRRAYLDLVEHVVRDYAIDGIYFDSWLACYFWPRPGTCYCEGCRKGFAQSTGLDIPYHEKLGDYTPAERVVIRRYHAWYQDQLIGVLQEVRRIVKTHSDIPLIYNINNPERLLGEDPRVLAHMDAFLYERGQSMLHRAEGVSLARALGLAVWPYVSTGVSSRAASAGVNVQQEILVTAAFGGGPIVYGAYRFVRSPQQREILRRPFGILARHEPCFQGAENDPYAAVLWGAGGPAEDSRSEERFRTDVRSSTLGAFAACLHRHIQVTSALPELLDDPARLARYKVLYLANLPCLSGRQIRNLRDFVTAGGGLVVSYGASLYRQEGEPPQRPVHLFQLGFASPAARLSRQDRFALEDLIRVRPEKPSPDLAALIDRHSSEHAGFQDLYVRARDEGGLRQTAWPAEIVPLCDYQAVRPLDGATVAADIICGDGRAVLPGVVLSRHGKGRVAYVAAAMESLYLRTNLRELADAIQSLILWAAPQPPPYTIDGPDCLIANLTTGDDACVLHLVNWTGSKLEQAGVNEYGLAPVENVRLRLRKPPGRKIAQVALLVDASLQQKDLDDSLEILLPRVEAYQGIRFRWA